MNIPQQQHSSQYTDYVQKRNAKDAEAGLPGLKTRRILLLVLANVPAKVTQVHRRVAFQVKLHPLVPVETRQHLVEDVVVLLLGQWPDDARLVQEIAVDLGPIQSPIGYLHLYELSDST